MTEIDRVFAHWRALRDGTGEMHRDAWCHRAGERQSMRRVTLDVARAAGLRRCAARWDVTVRSGHNTRPLAAPVVSHRT